MLLTEKEAKNKMCCQPLMLEECNRGVTSVGGMCTASDCMAWRWSGSYEDHKNEKGFCGLAGITKAEGRGMK